MGLLSRLFGRDDADGQDERQLAEMVERVVRLSPRLRRAAHHQSRLEAAIGGALDHLGAVVNSLGAVHDASPAAWSSDASIHAFFGAADEVPLVFGRSSQLRGLFRREPALQEAYAVLGMAMQERRTLGVAEQGGATLHDVQQTTVSFSDHQVRICARDEVVLKEEVLRRLVDQLALEGLARVAADHERRDDLERDRALLKTRLQLLERQGTGMRSVVGSAAGGDAAGRARLRAELEENDRDFAALGSRAEALERELQHVCEVFADATPLLQVSRRRMRLSRMNVVLDDGAAEGDVVEFSLAHLAGTPPQHRAFALVRIAKAHVQAPRDRLAEAHRLL